MWLVLLQVPVGRATLGRIINVIGEAIDERGDISKDLFHPLIFLFFVFVLEFSLGSHSLVWMNVGS